LKRVSWSFLYCGRWIQDNLPSATMST
jgi:hypothetical protein